MKTSKSGVQASIQEECGVWLDTADLKVKAKRKMPNRPISKMLNPLARGAGYSLAVALNFTQTKMQMPITKQSSISSFFTPQRRVINGKASSDEQKGTPPDDSSSPSTSIGCSSTLPSCGVAGSKRRRDVDLGVSAMHGKEEQPLKTDYVGLEGEHTGCEGNSERVCEREDTTWWEDYKKDSLRRLNMVPESEKDTEEMEKTGTKRRLIERLQSRGESDNWGEQHNENPRHFGRGAQYSERLADTGIVVHYDYDTQDFRSQHELTDSAVEKENLSRETFFESLQSEEGFCAWLGVEGRTSTQESFRRPDASQKDTRKENSEPSFLRSPSKNPPFTWTERKTALPKKRVQERPWDNAKDDGTSSIFSSPRKRSKLSGPPLQKRTGPGRTLREAEDDSLAMLFTQDSEGFRVIAHRTPAVRSPMKDQTNLAGVGRENRTAAASKTFVNEEEEEEMLFTQDSQGNMVIKHCGDLFS